MASLTFSEIVQEPIHHEDGLLPQSAAFCLALAESASVPACKEILPSDGVIVVQHLHTPWHSEGVCFPSARLPRLPSMILLPAGKFQPEDVASFASLAIVVHQS